jgi:hypothetical protein
MGFDTSPYLSSFAAFFRVWYSYCPQYSNFTCQRWLACSYYRPAWIILFLASMLMMPIFWLLALFLKLWVCCLLWLNPLTRLLLLADALHIVLSVYYFSLVIAFILLRFTFVFHYLAPQNISFVTNVVTHISAFLSTRTKGTQSVSFFFSNRTIITEVVILVF